MKLFRSTQAVSVILALIIFPIAGCTRAPHSENVKPGDPDYPIVNPHPIDVIKLTVIIPASIKVQLHQGYTTRRGGGSIESGPPCAYIQTTSQARLQYSLASGLELNRTAGDTFSGAVILDRYLPGQCDWGFAGAWYRDDSAQRQSELLVVSDASSQPENSRLDFWCIRSPKRDPRIIEVCLDIQALGDQFPEQVSAMKVKDMVSRNGSAGAPLAVGRGLKSIVIQFHDFDAGDRDLALRTE